MNTQCEAFTKKSGNWKDIFLLRSEDDVLDLGSTLVLHSCKIATWPKYAQMFFYVHRLEPKSPSCEEHGCQYGVFALHDGIKKGSFVEPCRAETLRKLKA